MERSAGRRSDPGKVLPGARSILVGAVRYAPQNTPPPVTLRGKVSCYAWGDDYHLVVGEKASRLSSFLKDRYGAAALDYVDTGPILERLWAATAGVGWIGKNAMALNKDLGSYFFLAVIVTDLELAPDAPATDQCGACTLCVEACPTGAIVQDRVVDSRRCLSFHTIELRGSFPALYRPDLGTRVFGCDDCQSVCPWNRAPFHTPTPFLPRGDNDAPDLVDLLSMGLHDYTRRFRGSAMKRATYHGLRRNAALALGNALAGAPRSALSPGNRLRARRALEVASSDPEPAVAEAASWALGND
jgi:epoxyqueuosine reductase